MKRAKTPKEEGNDKDQDSQPGKTASANRIKRAGSAEKTAKNAAQSNDRNKLLLIPLTIVAGVLASWVYNTYLAGLVNTPLKEPRVTNESLYKSSENLDRYWGTYRFVE
jgi:hypothetical protein